MRAFVTLNMLFGIKALPETRLYWSKDPFLGMPTVQKIMPRNRFEKICQYLHLNKRENRLPWEAPNYDKLFKVRPLLEAVSVNFRKEYRPSKFVSVDEGMVKYKGRLGFKHYMPLKPVKWGIKVWVLAVSCVRCKSTREKKMAASLNTALGIMLFPTLLAVYRGKIITSFVTIFLLLSDWLKICLPIIYICVELRVWTGQIFQLIWNHPNQHCKHFVTGNQFFGRKGTLWQLSGKTRKLYHLLAHSVMLEATKQFAESRRMERTLKFQRSLQLSFTTSTWGESITATKCVSFTRPQGEQRSGGGTCFGSA